MEACDGLLGAGDAGLLARDDAHIVHSCVELLGVRRGFADAHIHNDLLKARNLVDVVDSELALQLGDDFRFVKFFQARSSHW